VKSRKRGIKASRPKLDAAMLNAGIKTQSLLAEHIATKENLQIPPKDTVNRAFRQESVSPTTIARIAKVLSVEAHTLYLSLEESKFVPQMGLNDLSSKQSKHLHQRTPFRQMLLVLLAITAMVVIWLIYTDSLTSKSNQNDFINTSLLGRPSIVVYSHSEITDTLADAIEKEAGNHFTTSKINRTLVLNSSMSVDIAREYQSDGVLTLRTTIVGRFIGLQIYLYINGVETLFWTDSFLTVSFALHGQDIAQQFIQDLNLAFSNPASLRRENTLFASMATQEKYLNARELLNNSESEINLKRAQAFLQSAIQTYPQYANASAALCESFVDESWRGDEQAILQDAQRECDKAISIAPNNSYVRSTLAFLFRRTGRLDESIKLYQNILVDYPDDIDANSGIASAYLEAFRQNLKSYPEAKKNMVNFSRNATELEPDYWRHHSNLGLFSYFAGNQELAADAFGVAAGLNPNELAFTNVGTINKCIGNIDKAEYFYNKAIEIAPESYIGKDYLGSIYFYKKDFRKSAELKKQALETLSNETGGIHQMWGELGHSYRKDKQINKAIESYLIALKIIERDALRGNIAIADKIFRYQYKLLLTTLAPNTYTKASFNLEYSELRNFLSNETDAAAFAALAHSFFIMGNLQQSQQALEKATSKCSIYKLHPDLSQINVQ